MRRILAAALSAAAISAGAACAPSTSAETDVIVLAYQPKLGRYDRKEVTITTLDDLVTLDGSIGKIIGNAEIDFDSSKLMKKEGSDVKADFKEIDGVLLPADFHSLNMVTAYYNIERAYLFYKKIGMPVETLGKKSIYYFPKLTSSGTEITDNAMYMFAEYSGGTIDAFAILPFDQFQMIPLAINLGVLGHEFTHAVFSQLTIGHDPRNPINNPQKTSYEASNVYTSIDEGLADFMGTAITCDENFQNCDPSFIGHSISGQLSDDRILSEKHCIKAQIEIMGTESALFRASGTNYVVGTVLASSLWSALMTAGATKDRWMTITQGILATMQDDSHLGIRGLVKEETEDLNFSGVPLSSAKYLTMTAVLNAIASHMSSDKDLQQAVCNAFADRFFLQESDLKSGCPSGIQPLRVCYTSAKAADFEAEISSEESAE